MPPTAWVAVAVALVGLATTLGVHLIQTGRWAGRVEAFQREWEQRDIEHQREHARINEEIDRLRAWKHKLGEDPNHALTVLHGLLQERVQRLEQRSNGQRDRRD